MGISWRDETSAVRAVVPGSADGGYPRRRRDETSVGPRTLVCCYCRSVTNARPEARIVFAAEAGYPPDEPLRAVFNEKRGALARSPLLAPCNLSVSRILR